MIIFTYQSFIKRSKSIDISSHESQGVLLDSYLKGFEYSDCSADDSRLTILNAVDAKKFGADIYTRTFVNKIEQIDNIWEIQTTNSLSGESQTVKAKVVINATGPWVDTFLKDSYRKIK